MSQNFIPPVIESQIEMLQLSVDEMTFIFRPEGPAVHLARDEAPGNGLNMTRGLKGRQSLPGPADLAGRMAAPLGLKTRRQSIAVGLVERKWNYINLRLHYRVAER